MAFDNKIGWTQVMAAGTILVGVVLYVEGAHAEMNASNNALSIRITNNESSLQYQEKLFEVREKNLNDKIDNLETAIKDLAQLIRNMEKDKQ